MRGYVRYFNARSGLPRPCGFHRGAPWQAEGPLRGGASSGRSSGRSQYPDRARASLHQLRAGRERGVEPLPGRKNRSDPRTRRTVGLIAGKGTRFAPCIGRSRSTDSTTRPAATPRPTAGAVRRRTGGRASRPPSRIPRSAARCVISRTQGSPSSCPAHDASRKRGKHFRGMGLGRVELPTSRLSGESKGW